MKQKGGKRKRVDQLMESQKGAIHKFVLRNVVAKNIKELGVDNVNE